MNRNRTRYLTTAALITVLSLPALAQAQDNIDDYWPSEQALDDCGYNYVRDSAAPTVSGARSRCAAQLERRMKVAATMARLSTPRMGGATPEWEAEAKINVAKSRTRIDDAFAKRVQEWIAERKR